MFGRAPASALIQHDFYANFNFLVKHEQLAGHGVGGHGIGGHGIGILNLYLTRNGGMRPYTPLHYTLAPHALLTQAETGQAWSGQERYSHMHSLTCTL